jgi:TolB-like protein
MLFLFESLALDAGWRELRHGADLRHIEPQVFDVLELLIRNRDRVVGKDDLIATVWGGRIVSDATLASRINAARAAIGDNGQDQRLIRTVPRKGFRFIGEVRVQPGEQPDLAPPGKQPLALPDGPSIAVLPFQNMSADPEQDYFADGVVEDIITALSQMRWLFVIARSSSFTFKGNATGVKQAAQHLGVRYIVEGSVRKTTQRVRVAAQLIDALTEAHLWSDRVEGDIEDIFELQDRVVASIIGAIAPRLEHAEIVRASRKPTQSLDAYDYYLRGMAALHRGTRETTSEALQFFRQAVQLDSSFSSSLGMGAWCHDLRKWNGWWVDGSDERTEALRLARQAVELGRDNAVALSTGGFTIAHVEGDLDYGRDCIERALALNPNLMLWTAPPPARECQ